MTRIAAVLAVLGLALVALFVAATALQPGAMAAPEAPAAVTIIDECTEAKFDSALAKAKGGDTIWVRCDTEGTIGPDTITFTAEKAITRSVTISGTPVGGGRPNILSGGGVVRLFTVSPGKALTLTGIVVENGYAPLSGGCVRVQGALAVLASKLQYCRSGDDGGAIAAGFGSDRVSLVDSTVYSNSSAVAGGGLYLYGTEKDLRRVVFDDNSAGAGGGLFADDSIVDGMTLTITQNTASEFGGGLVMGGATSALAAQRSPMSCCTETRPPARRRTGTAAARTRNSALLRCPAPGS